jgi:hypothetical protein
VARLEDMQLLNSTTLDFKVFNGEELPPYTILSHTWGPDEVTYQEQRLMYKIRTLPPDLQQDRAYIAALEAAAGLDFMTVDGEAFIRRTGYSKIKGTALIAQASGIKWFWVDTCCIRNVAQKTMPYESGGCCRRNRWPLKL